MRGETDLSPFVDDPGNGFDAGRAGMGPIGMEERLRTVGGDFKIRSSAARGTRIEARVPLKRSSVHEI